MRWSFPVARLLGTELRIHAAFLLLLAWVGTARGAEAGWDAAVSGVLLLLMVFACVVLHEFGHALAARRFGIRTPDITLMPMGGVAHLERIPEKPTQEILVALAGPAVSAVLAAFFWGISGFSAPRWDTLWTSDLAFAPTLLSINLGLLLFNLLPAFPMDGGRVLRALLALRMQHQRATRIAAGIGQALALFLGLAGLLLPAPTLFLVAIFVYFGAASEAAQSQLRSVSRGHHVRDIMITPLQTLRNGATLGEAVELLRHSAQQDLPCVGLAGEFLGLLTRKNLIMGLHETGSDAPALAYAERDLPFILPQQSFAHALLLMQKHAAETLPVLDEEHRLIGLFTQEKVAELLLLQNLGKRTML
ncbi:MAG: hypothetical protein RLZZ399_1771 [Verrucomicrobiota bacterium]|jgi:stage IV sporulation protein FB